jgi:hypothetical protein
VGSCKTEDYAKKKKPLRCRIMQGEEPTTEAQFFFFKGSLSGEGLRILDFYYLGFVRQRKMHGRRENSHAGGGSGD